MNAVIVLRGALRLPSLRSLWAAWLRGQRVAVAASALCRNQLAVCASAPLQFAPERPPARAAFVA